MEGAASAREFVDAYAAGPASVLSLHKAAGQYGISLTPVFANSLWRSLFRSDDSFPTSSGWLHALSSVQEMTTVSLWLGTSSSSASGSTAVPTDLSASSPTLTIEVNHPSLPDVSAPVKLLLAKTVCRDELIITSFPLGPLPSLGPPASETNSPPRASPPASVSEPPPPALKRPIASSLRLRDFPPQNSANQLQHQIVASASTPPASAQSTSSLLEPSMSLLPATNVFEQLSEFHYDQANAMIRDFPWETTALGPRDAWPDHLISVVGIMRENPYPAAIWYGDELNIMYNGAYAMMAGAKHPWLFGKAGSIAWGELWPKIGPLVETVRNGKAVAKQDDLLLFERLTEKRLPEETYHSWSWIPIVDPTERVVGLYNTTFDTTSKVLAARRLKILANVCERAMATPTMKNFSQTLLEVLSDAQYEAPFAALYTASALEGSEEKRGSTSDLAISDSASITSSGPVPYRLHLVGSLGVPEQPEGGSHAMFPRSFQANLVFEAANPMRSGSAAGVSSPSMPTPTDASVESNTSTPSTGSDSQTILGDRPSPVRLPSTTFDWSKHIAAAMKLGYAVHVPFLPPHLMKDIAATRGWNDQIREAVVVPVTVDGESGGPLAVLILGVNSRRPYDEAYAAWVDVLRMTLCSALNSVMAREAETRRADQLAQLDAAKTAFFSNASHELRTPLTLIAGPLGEALNKSEDRFVTERLGLASRNVARLARLVDSLLDFSKIEAGRLTGRFGPVLLASFTEDLASLFRSTIERNNVEYNVDCPANDKSVVYVDPELWEKIIFNLVGNAFKYTLAGTITVRMRISPLWATLTVTDTGVGIPARDLERIFERFHRVEAVSRSHEGTGIGLALTKELVRLHGGSLSVTSVSQADDEDNHGSTFTVNIPMGQAHLPRAYVEETPIATVGQRSYARGIIDEAAQWGRGAPMDVSTPSDLSEEGGASLSSGDSGTIFFKKSDVVLIVDDNSDMRRYIRSIFARYCTVADACNGAEALELMTSGELTPDVIVTDRMMPVMDGDALMLAMKARPNLRRIPVVMVTADASDEARLEGLLSGADDYIPKPFTSRQLLARTHLQMQVGRRKTELEQSFEASTHQLRVLSELAPVGIFRAEPNGHITWANPTWYELTEHDSSTPLDDWLEFVIPGERENVQESWARLCETLSPQRLIMEFNFTSGRCVQAQFNVLEGKVLGAPIILGTLTDISERRMLQQAQLAHAEEREAAARKMAQDAETRRQEAEERRRAQELLIDVTSHELRQPVSAILNCASLVRSNYLALRDTITDFAHKREAFIPSQDALTQMEEDLEALEAIYQCGLSQERIANDVLSLSRIQLEVLSILPTDFNLKEEMRRICSLFQNELHMKTIDFNLRIGPTISQFEAASVCVDKSRFGQIVTNLLSNAIKFTDVSPAQERKIEVTLDVSVAPPDSETCAPPPPSQDIDPRDNSIFIYVSVKDSGPGLKPTDLQLLFQRFAQGSNSHEVFGGSGLGLFVSRKLCELMDGRIEVVSQFGEGATFRFFVKGTRSKVHAAPAISPETSAHRTGELPARPLRVLITEDNQINQTVLNRQLKKSGCETALANNGAEALETIRDLYSSTGAKFDVVLMDCEMPVMNGYDAVREIRRFEDEGSFPRRNYVIALTGNARSAQVQSALDAGMDAVMIKPYKINELLEMMRARVAEELISPDVLIPADQSPLIDLPTPPARHTNARPPITSVSLPSNAASLRNPASSLTSALSALTSPPDQTTSASNSQVAPIPHHAPPPPTSDVVSPSSVIPPLANHVPPSSNRSTARPPPPPPPSIAKPAARRPPPPPPFPPPASVQTARLQMQSASGTRPAVPASLPSTTSVPRSFMPTPPVSNETLTSPSPSGVGTLEVRSNGVHPSDERDASAARGDGTSFDDGADPFASPTDGGGHGDLSSMLNQLKLGQVSMPDLAPSTLHPSPPASSGPETQSIGSEDGGIDKKITEVAHGETSAFTEHTPDASS